VPVAGLALAHKTFQTAYVSLLLAADIVVDRSGTQVISTQKGKLGDIPPPKKRTTHGWVGEVADGDELVLVGLVTPSKRSGTSIAPFGDSTRGDFFLRRRPVAGPRAWPRRRLSSPGRRSSTAASTHQRAVTTVACVVAGEVNGGVSLSSWHFWGRHKERLGGHRPR